MSRRSAVATDTGTTCATFARAEPGLGSLPPQLERYTQSNKMSPSDELARQWSCRRTGMTDGCRKVKRCAFPAASGLREAVVIRRPLSEGKYDESDINCSRAGLSAQGVGRSNPNSGCGILPSQRTGTLPILIRTKSILSSNKRSTCDLYKKLPSLTHSLR